jgi:hypothetical protein
MITLFYVVLSTDCAPEKCLSTNTVNLIWFWLAFWSALAVNSPPIPSNNLWPSDGERFFARYLLLFLYMSTLSFRCQILFSFSYEWFACHHRLHSGLNIRTFLVEQRSKHHNISSSHLKLNSGLNFRVSRLLISNETVE